MSAPLFTPGPWSAWQAPTGEAVVKRVYTNDKGQRVTEWPAVCNCNTLPNMANANLIASAPALYDMLAIAVRTIETFNETLKEHGHEQSEKAADVALCANAILAKARGEA